LPLFVLDLIDIYLISFLSLEEYICCFTDELGCRCYECDQPPRSVRRGQLISYTMPDSL